MTAEALARGAIRVERDVLNEAGGWQDQFHASYGGTALYEFSGSGDVTRRCPETSGLVEGLNRSMVLVPTGRPRSSHDHAATTSSAVVTPQGAAAAREMARLARSTFTDLQGADGPDDSVRILASAMDTAWALKRRIMGGVLDPDVDVLIRSGQQHGALAGRLCGAGGSGFVLFLTAPGDQVEFLQRSGFRDGELVEVCENGSEHGPSNWMQSRTGSGINF